ncbi:MAG: ribosome recycling factor [Parcubacteria group bacterium]|nr:ribosome recycling factor [Parcubacteria group bacterium]
MTYNFSSLKKELEEIKEWFGKELSHIRTGRATPSILDSIKVDSYGSQVPINHVASVTVSDAKTILVAPWDKNQIKPIETAIINAGLGISTTTSGDGVRVIFPELTSETRETLLKIVKTKHEEARVRTRKARDVVWEDIQKKERDGEIPEDDKFRFKDEMQKMIDDANKLFNEMVAKKEKEISA